MSGGGGDEAMRGKRSLYTNLGLLALLCLLALVAFQMRKGKKPEEASKTVEFAYKAGRIVRETREEHKKLGELLGVEKKEITKFEIRWPGEGRSLVCERLPGKGWRITRPISAPADKDEVDKILDDLTTHTVERIVDQSPKDLGVYGLKKPRLEVSIWAAGRRWTLLFGDKNPDGTDVYTKQEAEPAVFLVGSYFVEDLEKKKPSDLREKHLIAFRKEKVWRLDLIYPDKRFQVRRKGKKEWELVEPIRAKADEFEVDTILSDLKDLKADEFVEKPSPNPAEYGFDSPQVEVQVHVEGLKRALVLLFGKKNPAGDKVYVKRKAYKFVALVSDDQLDKFKKSLKDLRDKVILDFKTSDAVGLVLEYPPKGKRIVCRKIKGKWFVTEPVRREAKKEKVEDVLYSLEFVRVDEFVEDHPKDLSKYGLDKPQIIASVYVKGKKRPLVLLVGKKGEFAGTKGVYVKPKDVDSIYLVYSTFPDDLTRTVDDLAPRPKKGKKAKGAKEGKGR